jgi:hypothetical protein
MLLSILVHSCARIVLIAAPTLKCEYETINPTSPHGPSGVGRSQFCPARTILP